MTGEEQMKVREFIKNKRTFLTYCFYGFLATLLETGLYSLFYYAFKAGNIFSTITAWILTVIFTFFTNKIFVYRSRVWKAGVLIREMISFFSCRMTTGVINTLWMFVFVDVLHFSGVVMKLLAAIVVGIINYTLGLCAVFRKPRPSIREESETESLSPINSTP